MKLDYIYHSGFAIEADEMCIRDSASTSTIFLKLVGHTKILGDFVVYTAGNFRDGSNKGFQLRCV